MTKTKQKILVSIAAAGLAYAGCQERARRHAFDFIDRRTAFAVDKKPDPSTLVVEIDEDGRLCLNRIETGAISDVRVLSEIIEAVFADREALGIPEKEIFIEIRGRITSEDFDKLIEALAERGAAPIRVIKN